MGTINKFQNFILIGLLLSLILTGCGSSGTGSVSNSSTPPASTTTSGSSSSQKPDTSNISEPSTPTSSDNPVTEEPEEEVSGTRDNTVTVLVPSADGVETYESGVAKIDASNSSEGYIMVTYTGSNPKVKLGIKGPDGVTYYYNLKGGYEVFPLTAGNGSYSVAVYENVEGTAYSEALSTSISVNITNEFGPYLYPSQYVNFNKDSAAVAKGAELAAGADTDMDVVQNVYNYIISNVKYDYDKAATVQSGYLPDVDETLRTNMGICFDYACLTATMLRTQRIPTRLEIGYMGEEYHAWISVYIPEHGWINGIIEFDGQTWRLMDPTFASTSQKPENFITEDDEYLVKYVY